MFAYRLCVLIGGCWFLVWRFGICGWVVSLLLIGQLFWADWWLAGPGFSVADCWCGVWAGGCVWFRCVL